MSAKDATRSAKDATRSAKNATRSAKNATRSAKAATSAAVLKLTIAYRKYSPAPHPPPLRKPSPSLSRFQPKYPNYHLWEKRQATSRRVVDSKTMPPHQRATVFSQ